jgi:hypothetical protein
MRRPSSASSPETFAASRSATSSPGSGDGASRYASRGGRTTARSGPEAAHASPSAPPAKGGASTTSGIYGRNSSASLRSAALSRSLVNKLRLRLVTAGSTKLRMTWKKSDMRSGRWHFRLRRWGRHTNENGYFVADSDRPQCGLQLPTPGGSVVNGVWSSARGVQCPGGKRRAILNPEFVLWLMGFPATWVSCGARAMRSCRLLRRSSSGASSRPSGNSKPLKTRITGTLRRRGLLS